MKIKKPTLPQFFFSIIFVWTAFLIWYARGYFFDESPDSGRDAFYAGAEQRIPDETNAAVGISGLDAPVDANPIKYGRTAINTFFKFDKESRPKVKNTLQFISVAREDIVDCSLPDAVEIESEKCTQLSEVGKLIDKNELMLKRYENLYNIHGWQDEAAGNGQNLISLNRLLASKIKLLILNKNYEEAFSTWRNNHIFISRVISQENTMITRAIFLVLDGINLQSLENLLHSNPELISLHHQELEQLLKPQGLTRYSIKNMLKAEYLFFNNHLLNSLEVKKATHVEFMRNRIYRFHLDFLGKSVQPVPTLSKSQRELAQKYDHFGLKTIVTTFLPHGVSRTLSLLTISGQTKGLLLVKSMHSKSAMINALNLRLKVQQQNISSENMQAFLNSASKELNCPFTERPMAWDASKRIIYCNYPEENRRIAEVRI